MTPRMVTMVTKVKIMILPDMLTVLERYVGSIVPGSSTTNCTCVSSSLCLAGDIITDGAGVFNLRRFCTLGQVCCSHPLTSTTTPATSTSTSSNPYTSGCGIQDYTLTNRFQPKITSSLSSSLTTLGEFPWMAAVLDTDTGGFLCGGSLVGEKVVLTAAHCVAGRAPASLTVRLGEWDASTTTESIAHQDIRVHTVLIHPNYYPPGVFYDLALLGLEEAADTDKANIGLECLPSNDTAAQTYVLDQCLVIGWGKETFGSAGISAVLKKIQVPTEWCLVVTNVPIRFPSSTISPASPSSSLPSSAPGSGSTSPSSVLEARLAGTPARVTEVVPSCVLSAPNLRGWFRWELSAGAWSVGWPSRGSTPTSSDLRQTSGWRRM